MGKSPQVQSRANLFSPIKLSGFPLPGQKTLKSAPTDENLDSYTLIPLVYLRTSHVSHVRGIQSVNITSYLC